ncbi:cGMP-dependent 3',5'-cyclic phosphodiesterase-like [Aplochiton taeniatus]
MTALERKRGKDLRGQQVFLRPEESSGPSLTTTAALSTALTDRLQDALLRLAAVVDVHSLREALRATVQELLPTTECVCVYLLEGPSRLVCDDPLHELPTEGKIRNLIGQLKRCQCPGLPASELPETCRSFLATPLPTHRRALVIPLLDQDRVKAISVLLVGSKSLSELEELHLNTLEKHAAVACRRVLAMQLAYEKPPLSPSPLQPHNALLQHNHAERDYSELDRSILQLCGELYDLDAASLQLKVINYLQQQTQSECCCLLLVSEDNHQLFCQVVGDKVLEEEMSFPVSV